MNHTHPTYSPQYPIIFFFQTLIFSIISICCYFFYKSALVTQTLKCGSSQRPNKDLGRCLDWLRSQIQESLKTRLLERLHSQQNHNGPSWVNRITCDILVIVKGCLNLPLGLSSLPYLLTFNQFPRAHGLGTRALSLSPLPPPSPPRSSSPCSSTTSLPPAPPLSLSTVPPHPLQPLSDPEAGPGPCIASAGESTEALTQTSLSTLSTPSGTKIGDTNDGSEPILPLTERLALAQTALHLPPLEKLDTPTPLNSSSRAASLDLDLDLDIEPGWEDLLVLPPALKHVLARRSKKVVIRYPELLPEPHRRGPRRLQLRHLLMGLLRKMCCCCCPKK